MKKFLLATAIFLIASIASQPAFSFKTDQIQVTGNDDRNKDLSILPDRASGEMKVRFKAAKAGTATIEVADEAGKVVLKQAAQLTTGINNVPLVNSLKLNEGFYSVRLVTNNQTYSSSFLIWK